MKVLISSKKFNYIKLFSYSGLSYGMKKNEGFTLVETLIAVLILGISLTATFSMINSVTTTASLVRNSYIASGLAQEGMEVVRNIRDSEWLSGIAIIQDDVRSIQYDSTVLGNNYDTFLNQNSNGLYDYVAGGTPTIFKRKIEISTVVPNVEKKIVVTITWLERGNEKTLTAEEHLFNWGQ